MPLEYINEPIEVRVDFHGNKVIPRIMKWNNKTYNISRINMIHSAKNGDTKLFFFSVSDSVNYFKLQLNTQSLEWRLMEMFAE